MEYILIFVFGMVLASFVNASMYRYENGYTLNAFVFKPSSCEKCNIQLKWYELIPVVSYVLFKGKHKDCGYGIPIYYSISEFLLGLTFVLYYYFNISLEIYVITLMLFSFVISDIWYKSIPATLTNIFLIISVLLNIFVGPFDIYVYIFWFSILGLIFLISRFKEVFGLGDGMVLVMTGIYFTPLISSLSYLLNFIYISGGILSVLLIFGLVKRKEYVPLIPLIYISFVVSTILEALSISIFSLMGIY